MVIYSPYENFDLYRYFAKLVEQIPEGRVASYSQLADALGDRKAALACAYMQSVLKEADDLPLHRVIKSTGDLGGYRTLHDVRTNSSVLREEGMTVTSGKVKFTRDHWYTDFETDFPLEGMREEQVKLSDNLSLEDDFDSDLIGAVDVSYDGMNGYASFVYDEDGTSIETKATMDATFPYIPGYLFYREFRYIRKLASGFNGTLFIDGNGLLHPRLFGLASAAGVCMNKATLGVAKSLLLGKVRRNWVMYNDQKVGYILAKRTIISPGHKISLESGIDLVKERYGHNYPAILKSAHDGTVRLRKEKEEERKAEAESRS